MSTSYTLESKANGGAAVTIVSEYLIENTRIKIDDEYVREDPEIILRQLVTDVKPVLQRQSKEVQNFQEDRLA
ncbi:hypothetical protein FACS18947_6740 [Bacteroidia bacterium]|nr:hypothetical protein FACS18947_6740 [Bacteroidia bacterium]